MDQMDNQDVSPEQPAEQPSAEQPSAEQPSAEPTRAAPQHDETQHDETQHDEALPEASHTATETIPAPMEAYHSPEPEDEEIEPVSTHAPFDILDDEIPSFGALLAARPSVFENPKTFENFSRKVDGLESTGETGRRRGLGLWMLGRYDEAAEALAVFGDDDVARYTRDPSSPRGGPQRPSPSSRP